MDPVVLNHRGTPEPSSEIQRRLAAIHPRLFLKFIDGITEHWAVCLRWAENDPRWQNVQSEIVNPDRSLDIIGYLPMGCPADEAPSYLEKAFREFPRTDVAKLVDSLGAFNATAPLAAAVQSAVAEVLDSPDPSKTAPRRPGRPRKSTPYGGA